MSHKTLMGWYYLHVNGELIYKRDTPGMDADIRESPFARGLWAVYPADRECAWSILIEALASGARLDRIKELADKWHCDDEDAAMYAQRMGIDLNVDGNKKMAVRRDFINLQESPAGFGDTYLEAMATLCKELGYKPNKMWRHSLKDLLEVSP